MNLLRRNINVTFFKYFSYISNTVTSRNIYSKSGNNCNHSYETTTIEGDMSLEDNMKKNEEKKKREADDRAKRNERTKRQYKL